MRNLKVGTGTILNLVYRPDGSALVALDVDTPTTRVRVVPLPDGDGKRSCSLTGLRFAVSPDGRWAADVSFGGMRLWDLVELKKATIRPTGGQGMMVGVGSSHDGKFLLLTFLPPDYLPDYRLVAWDVATRRRVWEIECPVGDGIAASADRVVVYRNTEMQMFRLRDGGVAIEPERRDKVAAARTWGVTRAIFSPDGSQLALAHGRLVVVREAATGTELFRLRGHRDTVVDVAYSPDGRLIATGGNDERVKFWEAASGRLLATFDWRIDYIGSVAFAPDGLTCAAGGTKGRVVIWDVDA